MGFNQRFPNFLWLRRGVSSCAGCLNDDGCARSNVRRIPCRDVHAVYGNDEAFHAVDGSDEARNSEGVTRDFQVLEAGSWGAGSGRYVLHRSDADDP